MSLQACSIWFVSLAMFGTNLTPVCAEACDTTKFDATPPSAIVGHVNSGSAEFTWASDVDKSTSVSWVWNYILNSHKSSHINVSWPKANIKIPIASPLSPGGIYCNTYPISNTSESEIDDDAPLIYGANNTVQNTAVYKKAEVEKSEINRNRSSITTSYTRNGQTITVSFYANYDVSEGGYISNFELISDSGYYGVVQNISEIWSHEAIDEISSRNTNQIGEFYFIGNEKFGIGDNYLEDWAGWLKESPISKKNETSLVVYGKAIDNINGKISIENAQRDVIILDSNNKPVTTGTITLPVLK
ncbi:hypothetical protein LXM94_05015 [Rhizobium sp. TRM95111]|uniref:hypothetical protein n=1 Tax=Rhizobium alarense TaxID=2846851 RepID=UPI001F3C7A64|nr:hypothetical protein [Rhizobium alarense]MCF3639323.1 hypothetical protein [Rhizobium alarense]